MQPSQPAQPDPLTTTLEADGVRLDRAVADWRGLSRAAVLRLLDQGAIQLNGRSMRRRNKGDLLSVGDRIRLDKAYAAGEAPVADHQIELAVLAQGDGWLVVDKPAGVPVRPHALGESGAVLNAIAAMHPEVVGVGEGGLRSGIVHRLDNDTSGALLVATRQDTWAHLREAFSAHRVSKRYLALVHGTIDESGTTRRDLRVASHQPARVAVEPEGKGGEASRTCSLSWKVIERVGDVTSLIEVDLHTGFLHQVRAMMNDLGHPVVGDAIYGRDTPNINARRQMLHAKSLAYEQIHAEAPVPEDMQCVLQSLRA
jgi:23S rRNA pseudouridine1911/1915/1917 synthase